MTKQISILSTKKLQSSQHDLFANAGLSLIDADFIAIKNADFSLSVVNENLLFTSSNAVKAVSNHAEVQNIRRNPTFCVGEKTADLLDEFGFTVIENEYYATDLASILISKYQQETFTFFNGNLRLETLPNALKDANVIFNEVEVYQTVLTPHLIKASVDGILFFSPSGVESYLSANEITNQICFCIGKTTAKALENRTENIIIANPPSVENTIIQAINHYKKTQLPIRN